MLIKQCPLDVTNLAIPTPGLIALTFKTIFDNKDLNA